MALISAKTILTSLSLFHITLGFFFLTSPITVAEQAIVYILGESMGLPYPRGFETPSPVLAFLGIVLASGGISDLVTLSLPEEVCLVQHWGMQAPLRLFISMNLMFYSFLFSASSPLYGGAGPRTRPAMHHQAPTTAGDGLKNRLFFTFIFVETISWFWVWVTLREERNEILARKARKHARQSH